MNTLIVHPSDASTEFLSPIKDVFTTKTVISGGINKTEIATITKQHERFIAMGHGSPWGLFSVHQFRGPDLFIIDRSFVELLRSKPTNIFIWCYAYEFAKKYEISAFCTNMFVSEIQEAELMGIKSVTEVQVDESNKCFVREICKYIHLPVEEIYDSLMKSEYAFLSQRNPIAAYNFSRLHCTNPN
jgi:hypothetical protein